MAGVTRPASLSTLVVLIAVLTTGLGCISAERTVRAQFARAQDCPAALVSVSFAHGATYRASGCGRQVVYVCSSFGRTEGVDELRCVEQGLKNPAPAGERERPPESFQVFPPPR
jgi:hypothetical protein